MLPDLHNSWTLDAENFSHSLITDSNAWHTDDVLVQAVALT